MIHEAIHFQNSPAENPAITQDAFLQFFHIRLHDQTNFCDCTTPSPAPYKGRYFRRAPKLRLEFGLQTKFETNIGAKYLYHKRIGRMETNHLQTYATSQC